MCLMHQRLSHSSLLFLTIFLFGNFFAHSSHAATETQEQLVITFAVVPQQSTTKLAKKWGPIFNYLSHKTGYNIDFKTAKNIPTFEERCALGEYDIAYMNPYHYTLFHESPGYEVFAREKLKSLKGIIVVREDSSYQTLEELAKNTLAFPSPAAFAASIVTRSQLSRRNVPFTPKYVSSHDSVYMTVSRGLFAAGGGIPRTFNNLNKETRDQLRILWTSKDYPPHAFVAHPRIPKEIVTSLQEAMLGMVNDPEGMKLLKKLSFIGLVAATDNEWDDIRDLKLGSLTVKNMDK